MWLNLIYVVAGLIAIRSLLHLMEQHLEASLFRLKVERGEREAEERERLAAEQLEQTLEAAKAEGNQQAA